MNYAAATLESEDEAAAFRIYVTDAIYSTGMTGMQQRYYDILHPNIIEKSGDEIAQEVITKLKLKVKEG